MDELKNILTQLKVSGCSGVKISFEDEGASLNEVISMRYLTSVVGIKLTIKIGGCEAKRDIVDCLNISCDSIVAPMIESAFALNKFSDSLKQYNYTGERGFNLETINAYNNLEELSKEFSCIDFVTVGRGDLTSSLNNNRADVNNENMYEMTVNIFKKTKEHGKKCYLGGSMNIESKYFICKLINHGLLDKFETRYVIFDVEQTIIEDLENIFHLADLFEIKWLQFISESHKILSIKDSSRIKKIEERLKLHNDLRINSVDT